MPELSEEELRKIEARMEEGFYSDESIRRFEHAVREQAQSRRQLHGESERRTGEGQESEHTSEEKNVSGLKYSSDMQKAAYDDEQEDEDTAEKSDAESHTQSGESVFAKEQLNAARERSTSFEENIIISKEERDEVQRKYEARLNVIERYSERQLRELKNQLEREKKLLPQEREMYLEQVEHKLAGGQLARLSEKAASCEGKNYVIVKRVLEEAEQAQIPLDMKKPILEKLRGLKRTQAEKEVEQLIAKMPKNLDRSQYKQYVQRIRDYEDVDFTPYEVALKERRKAAERQEIANTVKRARKVSREDFVELKTRLRDGDFLPELIVPYIEKIDERIRELDTDAIALICPNPMQMTFEEGMQAYEQIEQGDFLPELKKDALKTLKKRLSKIKTDECELLVKKLKEELEEAGIAEMPKHHFYPARKVLLKQAKPEEVDVIEYALASYAAGKGMFEYPILVVDATRSGTGKEGIIITPDHLYYSTLLNAYGVRIDTIAHIEASTGLLNKGLYMYQKSGTKTKIPYAVESKDLTAFAEVLDNFVRYLQDKPDSRSLTYLASEKHETICCFRCGYEYKGGNICPKCGYQDNE